MPREIYADPAHWLEVQTDAGTRDPLADRGPIDDVPYDDDPSDDDLLDPDAMVLWVCVGCALWVGVMAAAGWLA